MKERKMFGDLDFIPRYILYSSLLESVKSNSGIGFHNNDQGHPAYTMGLKGKYDYEGMGDAPEENELYIMMRELSESFKDCSSFRNEDLIFSWSDFCKMATDAFDKHHSYVV